MFVQVFSDLLREPIFKWGSPFIVPLLYHLVQLVLGTWYQVLSTWYQVLGTKYLALGTKYLVPKGPLGPMGPNGPYGAHGAQNVTKWVAVARHGLKLCMHGATPPAIIF